MSSNPALSQTSVLVRWITYASLAIGGTALDLISKEWVFRTRGLPKEQPPMWIIEPYFGVETAVNPGALFGMGAGFGGVFAFLSVVAAIGICVWLSKFRAIESWWLIASLGMVTGGIFGNLYDRLGLWNPPASIPEWSSGVRDWILIQYSDQLVWPNFNIADSLLVCGAIMLAIHSFFQKPAPQDDSQAQTATS